MTKDGITTGADIYGLLDALKEITRAQDPRPEPYECQGCREVSMNITSADETSSNIHEEWECGICGHIENHWWAK